MPRPRPLTDEQIAHLVQIHQQYGVPLSRLAPALGMTRQALARAIKVAGYLKRTQAEEMAARRDLFSTGEIRLLRWLYDFGIPVTRLSEVSGRTKEAIRNALKNY